MSGGGERASMGVGRDSVMNPYDEPNYRYDNTKKSKGGTGPKSPFE